MAGEIATAFVRIRPDSSGFQSETEGGVVSAVKKIAEIAGGIFAAEKIFDFGKDAVAGAASLQKSGEVISASFGDAGEKVKSFNETAAAGLGISASAGETTAAKFGILFQNMGIGKEKAADMTVGFEKLVGSISQIKGVDPTPVLNAITLAAAGNTRGLKQLGIVVDSTAIKNEALKLGLIKSTKDAIDPATKSQAIYGLATQNLGKYMDEAKAHAGDLTNQQRVLSAEWSNAKDAIGAELLPAVTALASFLADKLPPTFSAAQKAVEDAVSGIKAAFHTLDGFLAPILDPIIDEIHKVTDAFEQGGVHGAIQQVKDDFNSLGPYADVIAAIAGAVGGIVIAIDLWTRATAAWELVTKAATAVQEAFNFVMDANPIGIVVLAIAALVGALVVLYTRSQTVRDIVNGAFTDIKNTVNTVVTFLEGLWQRFGGTITSVAKTEFGAVRDYIKSVLDFITDTVQLFSDLFHGRWSKLWGDVVQIFTDIWNGIKAEFEGTVGVLSGLAEKLGAAILKGILDGIEDLPNLLISGITEAFKLLWQLDTWIGQEALKLGQAIVTGILNGVEGLAESLGSKVAGGVGGALHWASSHIGSTADEASSKLIGVPLGVGIVQGFLLGTSDLPSKVSQKVQDALNAARTQVQAAQSVVTTAFQTLGQQAIQAFQGSTTAELAKMQGEFNQQIKNLVTGPMNAALAEAASQNQAALSALDASNSAALAKLNAKQAALTPAEQKLQDIQTAHDEQARLDAIDAANQQLALDKTSDTATAAQLKSDQQAVDDALYAEQVANLQKQAATQRAALDAKVQAERDAQTTTYADQQKSLGDQYQAQQNGIQDAYASLQQALTDQYNTQVLNYQSQRDLQQSHLQTMLTNLQTSLAQQPGAWQSVHDQIMKLFATSFGPDYETAGKNLGTGFAKGLTESFAAVKKQAAALAKIIAKYLPHSPAEEGPLSESPNWIGYLTDGLKPGLIAPALAAALLAASGVHATGAVALSSPNVIGALSPLGTLVDQQQAMLEELQKQTVLAEQNTTAVPGGVGFSTQPLNPNAIASGAMR